MTRKWMEIGLKRHKGTRLQEHQRHTWKGELQRSAITERACSLQDQISWDGAGIIYHELDWRSRKIKKTLHIWIEKSNGSVMNKDDGWKVNEVGRAVL